MKTKKMIGINIPYTTEKIYQLFHVAYTEKVRGETIMELFLTSSKEAKKLKGTCYQDSQPAVINKKAMLYRENEIEHLKKIIKSKIVFNTAKQFAKKHLTVREYKKIIGKKS